MPTTILVASPYKPLCLSFLGLSRKAAHSSQRKKAEWVSSRKQQIVSCRDIPLKRGRMHATREALPTAEEGFSAIDARSFLEGLMPKKEVGAERFLKDHPHYDGRGIVIAILDSGVDPAAAGLQETSDGKPKLLDILDCTGSGDIDTSKIVKADLDGFITGASGTKLLLNNAWKNPSEEWRVGYKFAYELFTETLVSRIKKERRKKWDEHHMDALAVALRNLAAFDDKHSKVSEFALKKEREDLQNRVDLLQKLSDSYDDKGPIIDAVVWNDGDVWRVALDTQDFDDSGYGKLADFIPLTNYRIERKHGFFSKMDVCSYVTNVYDNGNVLSIVTDCSPHGTHVAAITAAYHPEDPILCGVAPGAQLISCKIGDSRLGSMETGTALIRALIAVVEHKCHLINMSYGEPTMMPDYGRFVGLVNEVVNKHGIIFISSAGNAGPSLNTVGAPGGTSSNIIGIGAYVSPSMAAVAHSIIEPPLEGLQYTWSSRGPTTDGDLGVCLSAPGAAIAPVPQWTLQRRMLMNGTSMASPCACGSVALLLSALKAEKIPISPWLIRKALENTAVPVGNAPEEPLTTGRGLIQVDKAYEYLQHCEGIPPVWYQVQLNRSGNLGTKFRGVYLREPFDSCRTSEWSVEVKPVFNEDADKLALLTPFEEHVRLEITEPTWVKAPEYTLLTHNGRNFSILVDPTALQSGVHYAEIRGIDFNAPWRGPLFRIPITVLKPVEILKHPPCVSFEMKFIPGHIERRFINVPNGSSWGVATIKLSGFDTPQKYFVNVVQIAPNKRPVIWENFCTFPGPSSKRLAFPIEGGRTMELTIAQFWSSGSGNKVPAAAEVEVEFNGLLGCQNQLVVNGSDAATRVDVKCLVQTEKLTPVATLTKIRIPYRPVETKLEPLSADRDRLPNGRQIFALILKYKFSLSETCKVRPHVPVLNNRIYDTEFESQFYMISDENKRVLAMGDVYPKGVKLPKGDYLLHLLLRHDNYQILEKLKKLVLFIDKSLDEKNQIRLCFHSSLDGAITGSDLFKSSILIPGETHPLYIASPPEEKLPKDASVGMVLTGKITYGKFFLGKEKQDANSQPCPASYSLTCIIPPAIKVDEKSKETNEVGTKKATSQILDEGIRDAKIKVLSSLPRGTDEERKIWNDLASALKSEYPKHLPLMIEILQKVSGIKQREDLKAALEEAIVAANKVIDLIDTDSLAKFFAMKSEAEHQNAAQVKKEMEMQRDALSDALYKKGLAIAQLEDQTLLDVMVKEDESGPLDEIGLKPSESSQPSHDSEDNDQQIQGETTNVCQVETQDKFDLVYAELRKWVDITLPKYGLLTALREKRYGRLGNAIKVLNELIQDEGKPPQKSLYMMRVKLLEQIGWLHWASYEKKWVLARFPNNLPLF